MPRRNETSDEDLFVRCPQCRGSGVLADLMNPEQLNPCSLCSGAGRISKARRGKNK